MQKKHSWEISSNYDCPVCGDMMLYCTHAECRLYRCTNCGAKFKVLLNKWRIPYLERIYKEESDHA